MDGSFISVHLTKNYNGVGIAYFANADNNHIWTVIIRKEQLTCNWEKVLEFLTMERLSREVFHIRGVVKRVLAPIDNPEMRNVSFPN
jgi:hypothetical protein